MAKKGLKAVQEESNNNKCNIAMNEKANEGQVKLLDQIDILTQQQSRMRYNLFPCYLSLRFYSYKYCI